MKRWILLSAVLAVAACQAPKPVTNPAASEENSTKAPGTKRTGPNGSPSAGPTKSPSPGATGSPAAGASASPGPGGTPKPNSSGAPKPTPTPIPPGPVKHTDFTPNEGGLTLEFSAVAESDVNSKPFTAVEVGSKSSLKASEPLLRFNAFDTKTGTVTPTYRSASLAFYDEPKAGTTLEIAQGFFAGGLGKGKANLSYSENYTGPKDFSGSRVWGAKGGTVTIDAVDGTKVTFTIKDAKLSVVGHFFFGLETIKATGTFTLNGSGTLTFVAPTPAPSASPSGSPSPSASPSPSPSPSASASPAS